MRYFKIISIILLFLFTIFLIFFFRYLNHYELIITHLLYIPVILVAFLWGYRVIYVIIVISIMFIVSDFVYGNVTFYIHDIIRTTLLLFAGIFVASMKGYIRKFSSLKKYRDIVFAVQEPVAIIDRWFNVFIQNKKFGEIFNIEKKGNILSLFNNIVHEQGLYDSLMACFDGTETVYSGPFITTQSDSRLFEIRCYPLRHDEANHFAVMNFRDITDECEVSLQQKRALRRQRVIIDILELLNTRNYGLGVISRILTLIKESTGVEAIGLKLNSGGDYRFYSSQGAGDLTAYLNSESTDDCCSLDNGFCIRKFISASSENLLESLRLQHGRFWTNDLDESMSSGSMNICRCMTDAGIKSFAVIPVSSGDNATGFFLLIDKWKHFFSTELLEFYEGIAQSIGIALDRISYEDNLKQIINEKELLIKEVHHRVKNNMQVITSLISLQAIRQTDENVRSVLNECQNRVRTMALVHEKLYSSSNYTSINFGNYLSTLVPLLMNTYRIDKDNVEVTISAQDIQLGINTAIPFAQLVNEILSNVFKHAFPDGKGGTVEIILSVESATGQNSLVVRDTGVGLPDNVRYPEGGNLGFQLIDALSRQIRGKVEFIKSDGVFIRVLF